MAYIPELTNGSSISGRAITATLYVSQDGDGSNGSNWAKAYNTIQDALDAASTDANDVTLILVAPPATYYDINTTGDPTWTGNYEIMGSHRKWVPIRNGHASATSIFKFTGKASLSDLAIAQTGAVDGVIFTGSGCRVRHCGFNSETITAAATSIYIDGSAALTNGGIVEDVFIVGNASYTKGLHINQSKLNNFIDVNIHSCLTGLHIEDTDSDRNDFINIDIGDCALGMDLDGGNDQHFNHITFHHNTVNVDDEVGDHVWNNINAELPVTIEPDNFTGVTVNTDGSADTWGADTEIRAAATSTVPFKVVAAEIEGSAAEKFRVRFSADSGTTHYDDLFIEGEVNAIKREAKSADTPTDFIFNAGTRISASAKSESGGNSVVVWIELQEL